MRGGVDIGSATSSTYTTVGADDGTTLTCKVRASNANGPAAGYTTTSNSCAVSSAVSLLLDTMTVAARAYSTRKLRAAYAGSALRVRRSSDNSEQDIGFSSNELDTSALTTFVGANDGFVAKWYDQSGAGDDAVQATAGSQNKIVNMGTLVTRNGKACLVCNTVGGLNTTAAATYKEANAVGSYSGGATYINYPGLVNTATAANSFITGMSGTAVFHDGIPGARSFYVDNVLKAGKESPMSDTLFQVRSTHASASTSENLQLCAYPGVPWTGNACELMVWTNQLSGGDATTLYNNQKAYWGTP
jgi:hypothetical protein